MLERDGGLSLDWGGGLLGCGGGFLDWWHDDLLGRFAAGNLLTPAGFDQMRRFGPMSGRRQPRHGERHRIVPDGHPSLGRLEAGHLLRLRGLSRRSCGPP